MKSERQLNICYTALLGLYFMCFCIGNSFAAVYLQSRGYTNTELGIILCWANIAGFFLSSFLASLIDRYKNITSYHVNLLLIVLEAVSAAGLVFISGKSLAVSLLFGLFLTCSVAANPILTELSFELSVTGGHVNYGIARGFGSLSYALMAIILGKLCTGLGLNVLPWSALLILFIQSVILLLLRKGFMPEDLSTLQQDTKKKSSSLVSFIRSNPRFCVLLLGTAMLFFSHRLIASFMINVVRSLGGDTDTMGSLTAFIALLEFPVMLMFDRICERIKFFVLLRLSAVFFAAKMLAIALADSIPALYAAQLFQMLSYAIYIPALVRYVNVSISKADSAKAQSLAYGMTTVGSIFSSIVGGILFDTLGTSATLFLSAGICTLGCIICQLGIRSSTAEA